MTKTIIDNNGINHEILDAGYCDTCNETEEWLTQRQSGRVAETPRNSDIYEYQENGGSVYADIAGLSFSEMEDYFGDTDPTEYL